jgi:hypothetical protein
VISGQGGVAGMSRSVDPGFVYRYVMTFVPGTTISIPDPNLTIGDFSGVWSAEDDLD